ncbi:hypothetical protein Kpol_1029p19 [Vanderwaltozyma polyspora DSM 70294]|uniref:GOLD domain-containing protein n=1 Tax=Vanderwaltozyma polyspora (strain ATCC 22028 / DSM 70294 / BCRC 21397 / CBS 2163 / NBRC 10782 / NRRL Y-8283 / UCD 57-17) TaxID=436907 RepID=A7TR77_VANPO|nr:uncharacterized protein Kpol_1029p19 [Vanderwaltozyma polyspora DSM 70294]EDO15245.1 hypothetical protein Kpol_1029p19 [Vanderwaltozyma polyspora DSM 70294]
MLNRLVACSLLFFFYLTTLVQSHNVLLPPYGRRCFFEELKKGDELSISFQFGNRDPESSDQLRGDFIVFGSGRNDIILSSRDTAHGEETLSAPYAGRFEYCFLNENSNIQTKDVSFNIWGTKYIDLDDENGDTLDSAVRKLSKLINEVKNEQQYIIIRERTHRNTAESTNDRVKWWSIFQLGVVVVNSIFQIYYLKRFFEVTSFV